MKALSVTNFLEKQYDTFPFEGEWYAAFGTPEKWGVWFIWGNSGNGKTSFTLQLCKELVRVGLRGCYNSLEEGDSMTLQQAFITAGLASTKRKLILVQESIEDTSKRLLKQKSPDFVIIDSFQYTGLSFEEYRKFVAKHPRKLIIIISQAEGKQPSGRTARRVRYDSKLKIWIEGHVAFSKGRYIGPTGKFVIWEEGALKYHGKSIYNDENTY